MIDWSNVLQGGTHSSLFQWLETDWCTSGKDEDKKLFFVQHVVGNQLKLQGLSNHMKLPQIHETAEATGQGVRKLSSALHHETLKETGWREQLECEKEVDDSLHCNDKSSISSSSINNWGVGLQNCNAEQDKEGDDEDEQCHLC